METLLAPILNFSVLVFILYKVLNQPLRNFVVQRHDTIKTELGEARQSLKTSKEKFDDYSSRLRALDAEVASLKDQAKREAGEMQNRIASSAQQASASLLADAKASSENMWSGLRKEIVRDLGLRVLGEAEERIRTDLTGEVQKRIRSEFSVGIAKGAKR